MEPNTVIGVISGAAATFVVVVVRMLVAGMWQSDTPTNGAASCRMHCGSDGANIEVTASSVPPQPVHDEHAAAREDDDDDDDAPPPPPPVVERQRSSMDVVIERVRSYRRTLVSEHRA